MTKQRPWPDDVHRELLRIERHRNMVYKARRAVAHAFVDCCSEGRPLSIPVRMACPCGYEFPESLGAYGCPACEGASGAAKTITHQETPA